MDERPRTTKKLLLQDSLGGLEIKYRREFAFRLLTVRGEVPPCWLKPIQLAFVELDLDSNLDGDVRASGFELAARVVGLCDLVYGLIDGFCRDHRDDLSLDERQRADLRRGSGPGAVCRVLGDNCRDWPPADPQRLPTAVRRSIDAALHELVQPKPLPAPRARPLDDRDLAVWHKTRATESKERLWLYLIYESFKIAAGLLVASSLAALYVLIVLVLHQVVPDWSAREDMMIAAGAVASTAGGVGLVVGQLISARENRRGRGDASR
jgi:hypothetical protein